MWAVSAATRVRMGHYLGAGNIQGAKLVIKIALCVGLAVGASVAIIFSVGRNQVGHIFSNDPEVVKLASRVAILVGAAYVGQW